MALLNDFARALVNVLLSPLRGLPVLLGLAILALLVAIAMLLVFKVTSNQEAIAAVKRRILASLFEIRLFNDDPRAIFRAQGHLLRHNLVYLRYSLVPLLWMIVPFVFLFGQLHFHYNYASFDPGAPAIVTARLAEGWEESVEAEDFDGYPRPVVELAVPDGVRLETPGVWAPELREVSWRVAGERDGRHALRVEAGGESYRKWFRVGQADRLALVSPVRPDRSLWAQIVYPAEDPLPPGPVESIAVDYREADVWFFGWDTWWWMAFLVLTLVFAFALRNRLGVQI